MRYIAICGLDGSGQTTQIRFLKEFLEQQNYQVVVTKEPTNNPPVGVLIREILQKRIKVDNPIILQLLFAIDRYQNQKVILTALKENKVVVGDRCLLCSVAYGTTDGLEMNWILQINRYILFPDLIFFLYVTPEECIKRLKKRGGSLELYEKKEKLQKVLQNYLNAIETIKEINLRTRIIDGGRPPEEVAEEIKEIVLSKIKERR
jgi:dTMP kinase